TLEEDLLAMSNLPLQGYANEKPDGYTTSDYNTAGGVPRNNQHNVVLTNKLHMLNYDTLQYAFLFGDYKYGPPADLLLAIWDACNFSHLGGFHKPSITALEFQRRQHLPATIQQHNDDHGRAIGQVEHDRINMRLLTLASTNPLFDIYSNVWGSSCFFNMNLCYWIASDGSIYISGNGQPGSPLHRVICLGQSCTDFLRSKVEHLRVAGCPMVIRPNDHPTLPNTPLAYCPGNGGRIPAVLRTSDATVRVTGASEVDGVLAGEVMEACCKKVYEITEEHKRYDDGRETGGTGGTGGGIDRGWYEKVRLGAQGSGGDRVGTSRAWGQLVECVGSAVEGIEEGGGGGG
ncbi:hypothetical protein TrRE_jg5260, partial [Triparma retinervis]